MRGIYNGEIKDRTHIFDILGSILLVGIFSIFWFYSAFLAWQRADLLRGIIMPIGGILSLWYFLIAFGREFTFLRINKENIIVKRPFLSFSPFKKDKALVVLPVSEIAEINIVLPSGLKGISTWRFISTEKKELLKFRFKPEFIFSTVDLDVYFQKNGMNIKLT
jgi:hypothetical protein